MEITGRVTADASVQKANNGKQVVNFSIVINDNYKPKDSTEVKRSSHLYQLFVLVKCKNSPVA